MAALRGSLTYARFYVDGELPGDFLDKAMRSIRLRAMKPLEPDDEDLERSGWCKLGEPFELDLAHDDVLPPGFVRLGFRTDRWQIPSSILRQRLRETERAYLEKKGRERLGRKERAELKEMTLRKLKQKATPATRAVDLCWSLDDGLVRFFSHANKPAAAMMELFQKTFSLRLVPEAPYTLAARLGLSREEELAWEALEPIQTAREEEL